MTYEVGLKSTGRIRNRQKWECADISGGGFAWPDGRKIFFFLKEDIYKKSQLDGVKSTQWEADRTENVKEKVVKNSNVAEIKEQRSHWSFN